MYKTRKNRIIFTLIYIAYSLFIFSNSMQDAAESGGRSMAVLQFLERVFGQGVISEHILRKAAHFTEFGVLGVLGTVCFGMYGLKPLYPAFAGLLTALTDETLQLFSPGRSAQVTDVWIDFAGCVSGVMLILILKYLFSKHSLSGSDREKLTGEQHQI